MGQPAPTAPSAKSPGATRTALDDWVDGAHGGPPVVSHGFAVEIGMLSPIAEGVGVAPKLRESGA